LRHPNRRHFFHKITVSPCFAKARGSEFVSPFTLDWNWNPHRSLLSILAEIADYAEKNPNWLETTMQGDGKTEGNTEFRIQNPNAEAPKCER
jgi:hypothetical protein